MKSLDRILSPRFGVLGGIHTEFKGASLAIHYRNASARSREKAWRAIEGVLAQQPKLQLLTGKKVWELMPSSPVNKWSAVRTILAREFGSCGKRLPLTFYLGDNATDELVFSQMPENSVAVGRHSRTAARYYLRSPAEVRRMLERWKEVTL